MSLTDLACRQAKPRSKPYKLSDSGGLYLEIMTTGNGYWRQKLRVHGKEKRLTLGSYPALSLIKAREKRDLAKEALQNGIDPCQEKQEKKKLARFQSEQTFEVIGIEWHKHYLDTWSKSHSNNILYRMEQDIFPQIGKIPIAELTTPKILACLQKVESRGAHETTRRCLQICGQVLRYAVITGRAQRDLTVEIRGGLKKYRKGHYQSIKVEELPELLKAINTNSFRLFEQTVLAIRLMLLTFVRTRELIEATWDEIDFDKAEWHIKAERMKMRNAHFVPLSKQSVDILKRLKELAGNREYVFPSISKPNKPMSDATILGGLKRLKYQGKMTGHGFRSLAMGAIKEKLGYRHEVIDRQLAHVPRNKVDKAYDRAEFLEDRIKMMQEWADYIDSQS